ncbi:hypothetical protein PR048_004164 [Dryococelus australis]|uniref:Uncharacterized protein n=1 Tax=Dryococelus australis TaxID=614101 RepID=A0ABQ9I5J5_9NEOP|nr:hypothetical protein PR048_004164 [Dryococelus australis]
MASGVCQRAGHYAVRDHWRGLYTPRPGVDVGRYTGPRQQHTGDTLSSTLHWPAGTIQAIHPGWGEVNVELRGTVRMGQRDIPEKTHRPQARLPHFSYTDEMNDVHLMRPPACLAWRRCQVKHSGIPLTKAGHLTELQHKASRQKRHCGRWLRLPGSVDVVCVRRRQGGDGWRAVAEVGGGGIVHGGGGGVVQGCGGGVVHCGRGGVVHGGGGGVAVPWVADVRVARVGEVAIARLGGVAVARLGGVAVARMGGVTVAGVGDVAVRGADVRPEGDRRGGDDGGDGRLRRHGLGGAVGLGGGVRDGDGVGLGDDCDDGHRGSRGVDGGVRHRLHHRGGRRGGALCLVHDGVEAVDGVGSVLDGAAGAVGLDEAVAALDDVSVTRLLLRLGVARDGVLDVVGEAVLRVWVVVGVVSDFGGGRGHHVLWEGVADDEQSSHEKEHLENNTPVNQEVDLQSPAGPVVNTLFHKATWFMVPLWRWFMVPLWRRMKGKGHVQQPSGKSDPLLR